MGAAMPLVFAASASAATTINVTPGAADPGTGSGSNCAATAPVGTYSCTNIRDAAALANQLQGDPTIALQSGSYPLTKGQLELTTAVTISGQGDTGSSATVIGPDNIYAGGNLAVENLTIDGQGTGCNLILESHSTTTLTLTGVTLENAKCFGEDSTNPGSEGGYQAGAAIYASSDTLTMTDSQILNNSVTGGAGGPASASQAAGTGGTVEGAVLVGGLVMSDSVVSGNTATGGIGGAGSSTKAGGTGGEVDGAGITVLNTGNATLRISSSEISDNTATGGAGADTQGSNQAGGGGSVLGAGLDAELVSTSGPHATITGSTISDNTAEAGQAASNTNSGGLGGNSNYAGGAGMYVTDTVPLDISASVFSGNQAIAQNAGKGPGTEIGYAGDAEGGAMYIQQGPVATIVNSTIAGNSTVSGTGSGTTGTIGSFGGGIDDYGTGTQTNLYNDTVADNSADATLGSTAEFGANLLAIDGGIGLTDTAVADPLPLGATNCATQAGGTFTDGGYNLEDTSPSTCGLSAAKHDQIAASGLATVLGANGVSSTQATPTSPVIPAPTTLAPIAGSSLIGHGGACSNPLAAGAPPLTVDERGASRGATCDIGAFQSQPLKVSGQPAITGTAAVGQTLTCSAGSFGAAGDGAVNPNGTLSASPTDSYLWSSGTTKLASTQTYTVTAGDQGQSLTCTETATGAYGQGSATSAGVTIPSAPSTSTTSTTPSTTTTTTTTATATTTTTTSTKSTLPVLTLSGVHQSHGTWGEKKVKHGPPVGTTFTFSLNTVATVTLTFARTTTGRAVGGTCVAMTRKNARKRHCTLSKKVGSYAQASSAGSTTLPFTGKLSGRLLVAGTYTVTFTATAGGATTAPHKLAFTIKR